MYFLFGEYAGNASEAARQYAVQYPNRRHPDKNVIPRLDHRMRTIGRLEPLPRELGRPRSTKTVAEEKAILEEVQNHPTISIRELSRNLELPKLMVHEVLKSEKMHPYHYTKVQALRD
ncbi:hypothetical protein TcasGA2_TC006997 [Tribolium castaneum]|uniref:DUF4817 domain-containing protein n=1 Tax=Tribolium castaneum TaxID=7070 RepID=D7GXN3_TRICA|nr:hypothetical protein TcasGA2_TC006997 [Tribolium castaneum]